MMHTNSKLLKYILKKYEFKTGSKLNYEFLIKISMQEKIEIKDLLCLLQIDYKTYYKLRKNSKSYTKIKFNKFDYEIDSKLERQGKITKYEFYKIQDELQIKRYTLIRILGASRYQYNKMNKDVNYEMKVMNIKLKHIVDLIKLDIKYIDKREEKYYTKSEIKTYCRKNGIKLDTFLRYYNINRKHYKFNKLAIEKSEKGLWIDDNEIMMQNEFANENYIILDNKCKKLAVIKAKEWNCIQLLDDLFNIGREKIIMGGTIVKKFYFDLELIYNILLTKAKYAMLGYYKKYKKQSNYIYYDQYENKYIDHLSILGSQKYAPQNEEYM